MSAKESSEKYEVFDLKKVEELLEKSMEVVENKQKVQIGDAKANIRITRKDRNRPENGWCQSRTHCRRTSQTRQQPSLSGAALRRGIL